MGWFILTQTFSVLIAIVSLGRLSEREKDLEILVLRQQLAIMKRKQSQPVRATRAEKMTLALLTTKLKPEALANTVGLYIATGGIEPLPDPSLSNAFDWVEEYYRDKVVGQ